MNKTLKYTLLTILIVGLIFATYLIYIFLIPNFTQNMEKEQYLLIYENNNFDDILNQLKDKSKISSVYSFQKAAVLLNYQDNIKQGRYLIPDRGNNISFLRTLRNGNQTPVNLTFSYIRTKEQLAGKLSGQLMIDSVQLIHLLNDTIFLQKYSLNPFTSVSIFLPNTYQVYWDIEERKLFQKMYDEYDRFWTPDRKSKAKEMNFSQDQVMTLASIVDAESNQLSEKAIIAGLYINRLQKNMALQADPTVIFATGDFTIKRVTNQLTRTDSPYNTYRNKGLPPGPIRIPQLKTIDAVLNYDKNNYIFMCAKETLNGEHNFSDNWAEHLRNAKKYQQALNARGIY